MTSSLKKLLLISTALLLGVVSSGVMAQTYTGVVNGTNYDFTAVTANPRSYDFSSQPWYNSSSLAADFATAVGTNLGADTVNNIRGTNYGPIFIYGGGGGYFTFDALSSGVVTDAYKPINSSSTVYVTATVHGGGAPEIDGSLAPKVGFLLGCLFLMFGRKKQNTEPMMAA